MTEFLSIADAKQAMKGDFVGIVSKIGDLKAGTSAKGDWTMKLITLEDGSGTVDMALFNDDIDKFKLGGKYEIENPWWKKKDGNLSLALGQYAKVKLVTPADEVQQTITEPSATSQDKKPLLEIMDAFGREHIDSVGLKQGDGNQMQNSLHMMMGSIAMEAIQFTLEYLESKT